MALMNKENELYAFLSYARIDDSLDKEKISELALKLQSNISIHMGRKFRIFIDKKDIEWGEYWSSSINESMVKASFLIPILTPAYFNSRYCREEYLLFRKIEKLKGRRDLICPVYYIDTERLEKGRWSSRKSWVTEIASRQYFDWRKLRLLPGDSAEVLSGIESMTNDIVSAIRNRRSKNVIEETSMTSETKIKGVSTANIAAEYSHLSNTQKHIVYALYTLVHPPEIAIDDLYELLSKKFNNEIEISSTAELFFRVKDLKHCGLLDIRPAGKKTSVVYGIPKVAQVLHEEKFIST